MRQRIRHVGSALVIASCVLVVAHADPESFPAGTEASSLGVDHYEVELNEVQMPELNLISDDGSLLATVVVAWGPKPEQHRLDIQLPDGRSFHIDWRPLDGLFVVSDDSGQVARKRFTESGWETSDEDSEFLGKNQRALALAAVAASDYRIATGQGLTVGKGGD